jgi:hypothetical protein
MFLECPAQDSIVISPLPTERTKIFGKSLRTQVRDSNSDVEGDDGDNDDRE